MLLDLNTLTSRDFEDLIEDLYSDEEWNVDFRAGVGPDGGRDLVISRTTKKDDGKKEFEKYVVQCKRYKSTVNKSHVPEIRDTVELNYASGYILAVTSDISEPLMQKFRGYTERGIICKTLRPKQIRDLIMKHESRFQKYFPEEYKTFLNEKRIIRKDDVLKAVEERFGIELTDGQVNEIIHNLVIIGCNTSERLKEVISDTDNTTQLIKDTIKELLGREATAFELVNFSTKLSGSEKEESKVQLQSYIRNTHEYFSKLRFRLHFDDFPISSIHFDEPYQHVFDFGTYHKDRKDGTLEITHADVFGYQRCVKLSTKSDAEFCVVTLQNQIFESKRILAIDFNCKGFSEFYTFVRGVDGKFYYVQYINDECKGKDKNVTQGNVTYVKIHRLGMQNANVLRQEMYFADDLKSRVGVDVAEFLGLYIGTKDEMSIYNILLE